MQGRPFIVYIFSLSLNLSLALIANAMLQHTEPLAISLIHYVFSLILRSVQLHIFKEKTPNRIQTDTPQTSDTPAVPMFTQRQTSLYYLPFPPLTLAGHQVTADQECRSMEPLRPSTHRKYPWSSTYYNS